MVAAVLLAATVSACEFGGSSSEESGVPTTDSVPVSFTGVDPCEGRNAEHSMCRVVAAAPLTGPGTANRIGIVLNGGPALSVVAGLTDTVAEYVEPYEGSAGLGPDGNFAERQDAALVAATDVTGDGQPELILWTEQADDHNEYRVLELAESTLRPLDPPIPNMWTDLDIWTSYHGAGFGIYRCDADRPGTLVHTRANASTPDVATESDFRYSEGKWLPGDSREGLPDPAVAHDTSVAFDCPHREQRIPRTDADKVDMSAGEGPTTAPPSLPMDCGTTDSGEPIVITAGSTTCEHARAIALRYLAELRGGGAQGQGHNSSLDGWQCSWPYEDNVPHYLSPHVCTRGDASIRIGG